MTLNEFRAWLEGYEEGFDEHGVECHPSTDQWVAIKAKLATVEVEPFTQARAAVGMAAPWGGTEESAKEDQLRAFNELQEDT